MTGLGSRSCPTCSATVAVTVRFCTSCGDLLPELTDIAALETPELTQPPSSPARTPSQEVPGSRPAATTPPRRRGVAAVGLAVVLGVTLLVGSANRDTLEPAASASEESEPSQAASPAAAAPVPKAPAAGPWGDRWIAQLASIPYVDGEAVRDAIVAGVRRSVPEAQVLRSDEFASLRPGYWVAYHEAGFQSGLQALQFCDERDLHLKSDCLGLFLSTDPTHRTLQCFRSDDGALTPACHS